MVEKQKTGLESDFHKYFTSAVREGGCCVGCGGADGFGEVALIMRIKSELIIELYS